MAKLTTEEFIAAIKELTVLELNDLVKACEEEFGVSADQLVLDDKGGVENMYYDDPQLSRSAIISKYKE